MSGWSKGVDNGGMWKGASRSSESGQAVVESALTLPLVVFLILGTLQLFMMMHARVLTQYAAYRATRAGSVNHGNCERMTHAAILSLMPAIESFAGSAAGADDGLADAFARHGLGNQYNYVQLISDGGNALNYNGTIVWLARRLGPRQPNWDNGQDTSFDQPSGQPTRLETRLVFWYPMRIPFANWVMSKIFLASFGLDTYAAVNPLMPVQTAGTTGEDWAMTSGGYSPDALIGAEMLRRNQAKEFVFPIQATYTMRMMTPAKRINFPGLNAAGVSNCAPTPAGL